MTKSQIEKKVIHLRKEIKYYCKVYPNSSKIFFIKVCIGIIRKWYKPFSCFHLCLTK